MLAKSYLKVACRTLARQKGYTFISVVGLALGIACCVLFFGFAQDEWTHDAFHAKAGRIFRVNQSAGRLGTATWQAGGPVPLGPALETTFPEVQAATRLARGHVRVESNQESIAEQALFADSSFFRLFDFPVLRGRPSGALSTPKGVLLTPSAAQKYFGDANPVGKKLSVHIEDETVEVHVAGVVAAPPPNSSIQFDVLFPLEAWRYSYTEMFRKMAFEQWDFSPVSTFVLLSSPARAEKLEAKLPAFARRHFKGAGVKGAGVHGSSQTGAATPRLQLQPLTDVHRDPTVESQALTPPRDPRYASLLAGAALLILFVACVNFAMLTLGRSARRTTEVGVRKAMGAYRRQVAVQFWGEAFLAGGLAFLLGGVLAQAFLPVFNRLVGKQLELLDTLGQPAALVAFAALALGAALVAGSYPALVLARLEPARVLRGHTRVGGQGRLTRSLVVVQFALSIGLVAGALVMSAQLHHMQTDLGFDQEQIIRITGLGDSNTGHRIFLPFRREAERHKAVEAVMGAGYSFFSDAGIDAELAPGLGASLRTNDAPTDAHLLPVGKNFVEGMGLRLAAGRGFSEGHNDANAVVVNEALVRAMGWQSAVGKTLSLSKKTPMGKLFGTRTVVGVVENFHTRSLRHEVAPLILTTRALLAGGLTAIYVRIRPGSDLPKTLSFLEKTWHRAAPERPFQYTFLSEVVENAYRAERRQRATVRYAAGLALLIACFGLFGLASLTVARRTKEIGIRKVLGASAAGVVGLLLKDVLRLVVAAFLLAAPVVYLAARWWLQQFAYRIPLGPAPFLIAVGAVGLVALLTVSYQAVTTALADPVGSLRDE